MIAMLAATAFGFALHPRDGAVGTLRELAGDCLAALEQAQPYLGQLVPVDAEAVRRARGMLTAAASSRLVG